MNALVEQPQRSRSVAVDDVVDIMDTGRFDQMSRIAGVMARSALVPKSLSGYREGTGSNSKFVLFDYEVVAANCFLIVNQAVRWGLDPFAVAQSTSIVRGKLCYEGKLVAGVISAKLGVDLDYTFNDKGGDDLAITVSGVVGGKTKTVSGTVKEWKTTGSGSPWGQGNESNKRMLRYRGAREWARAHTPALMLGVYTADEMMDAAERARDVTPPPPPPAAENAPALPKAEKKAAPRTDAAYGEMGRKDERRDDPPPPPAETEQPAATRAAAPEEKNDEPPPPPPGQTSGASDDGRDYERLLSDLEEEMAHPDSLTTLNIIRDRVMGEWVDAAPDSVFERAKAIYNANSARISKPKAQSQKPADPPPAEDPPPPPAAAADPAAASETSTSPVLPKADDHEGWYERGRQDFAAGAAFNKYPPILKEDGYLDAKSFWLDGYAAAKKAKK